MNLKRTVAWSIAAVVLLVPLEAADHLKLKRLKSSANPAAYLRFSKQLPANEQSHHALDRLTFGPRPGDLAHLRTEGLKKFVDDQLHPERVPEDPALAGRLQPLTTLNMSSRELYVQYPRMQLVLNFARRQGKLPDDPELRASIVSLADRYQVADLPVNQGAPVAADNKQQDPNEDDDLNLRTPLTKILSPDQIRILNSGKPDEKRQMLASLNVDQRNNLVWALHRKERQQLYNVAPVDLRRQLMRAVNPEQVVINDLTDAKLLRANYSRHQLEELMVDFWYNHFNVFYNKGADRYLVTAYERDAIRPRVFGKFGDLLLATAQSPAMLFYLDNWQSVDPNLPVTAKASQPQNIKRERKGLNENYGRELLELHTLGVDGGYTQKDVIEVARCFTGWTMTGPRKGDKFKFDEKVHDRGQKIVLGHIIPAGGGIEDGLKVIDILVHEPATAHFISLKLARRFVADDSPPSLVDRMAAAFTKTNGDIREVMRTMLTSPEFWSEGAYQAKVKTPFEMIVSAVRATGAAVDSTWQLSNEIQRLGEPLYRKIEPTGYSSANAEWVSSASLLSRMNFGLTLANNRVPGLKVDVEEWQRLAHTDPLNLARTVLQQEPSEQTRQAIQKLLADPELQKQLASSAKTATPQIPALVAGLALGSPEFQRR